MKVLQQIVAEIQRPELLDQVDARAPPILHSSFLTMSTIISFRRRLKFPYLVSHYMSSFLLEYAGRPSNTAMNRPR